MPTPNVDLSRAVWRKSSRSTAEGQNCVEIADIGTIIAVRDSKNPSGPALLFSHTEWQGLVTTFRANAAR
jgi:Domain of unknown function (DUF397)